MEIDPIKYALRLKKTGGILGYHTSSNEGSDYCNDVTVELSVSSNDIWYADSAIQAEYVRNFSTPWFNSSIRSPMNSYKADELEVVQIEIKITSLNPQPKIPSVKEFFTTKYKEDKQHLRMLLVDLQRGADITYSLYDLEELEENKGKHL